MGEGKPALYPLPLPHPFGVPPSLCFSSLILCGGEICLVLHEPTDVLNEPTKFYTQAQSVGGVRRVDRTPAGSVCLVKFRIHCWIHRYTLFC